MSLLAAQQVNAFYGDFQALFELDLDITEGETVAIIGSNGAGKSTLLKLIAGLVPVRGGHLRYDGRAIDGLRTHDRVRAGISLVPEGRRIFPSLSVEENLQVGAYHGRPGHWDLGRVKELFPVLAERARRSAAVLSGGEQQALAIGRALMANPAAVAAGRGLAGIGTHHHPPALRGPAGHHGHRHDGAAGGAERRPGTQRGGTRALPAGGPHHPVGTARGAQPSADQLGLLRHLSMEWLNVVVQGVLLGGLYAMLATGLSLVFGVMRLVNLAQGDLTILAAFLSLSLVQLTGMDPLLTLIVVVPVMMLLGAVMQRLLLDRTLNRGPLPPLLVTFGIAIVLQNLLLTAYTADSRGLDVGALEGQGIRINDQISIGVFALLTLLVAVAVLVALQLMLSHTALGRAMRATSDDTDAARVVGIDDRRIYMTATAIAMGTVAIGGVFLGIRTTFGPLDGPARLIFAFEAVIIGGLGSLWGTLVGGIALGVAQTVGSQINPADGILAGHLLFLAVLAVRPQGLFAAPRGTPGMSAPASQRHADLSSPTTDAHHARWRRCWRCCCSWALRRCRSGPTPGRSSCWSSSSRCWRWRRCGTCWPATPGWCPSASRRSSGWVPTACS